MTGGENSKQPHKQFPFPDRLLSREEVEEMIKRKGPRLDAWLAEWGVPALPKSDNPNPKRLHRVWSLYDVQVALSRFKQSQINQFICQAS